MFPSLKSGADFDAPRRHHKSGRESGREAALLRAVPTRSHRSRMPSLAVRDCHRSCLPSSNLLCAPGADFQRLNWLLSLPKEWRTHGSKDARRNDEPRDRKSATLAPSFSGPGARIAFWFLASLRLPQPPAGGRKPDLGPRPRSASCRGRKMLPMILSEKLEEPPKPRAVHLTESASAPEEAARCGVSESPPYLVHDALKDADLRRLQSPKVRPLRRAAGWDARLAAGGQRPWGVLT